MRRCCFTVGKRKAQNYKQEKESSANEKDWKGFDAQLGTPPNLGVLIQHLKD